MTTLTREHILSILREHKSELRDKFGVLRLGVFGSYSTEQAAPDSDVDIAVELTSDAKRLHNFLELERYLTKLLGVPVDLGIEHTIHPAMKEAVQREMIYV